MEWLLLKKGNQILKKMNVCLWIRKHGHLLSNDTYATVHVIVNAIILSHFVFPYFCCAKLSGVVVRTEKGAYLNYGPLTTFMHLPWRCSIFSDLTVTFRQTTKNR